MPGTTFVRSSTSIQEFGRTVADEYMSRIERALDRLLDYPESGPVYPGIRPQVHSLSVGSHHLFYDFDGQPIAVARVLHQAMVPDEWL